MRGAPNLSKARSEIPVAVVMANDRVRSSAISEVVLELNSSAQTAGTNSATEISDYWMVAVLGGNLIVPGSTCAPGIDEARNLDTSMTSMSDGIIVGR
jgi:hypothetical protein